MDGKKLRTSKVQKNLSPQNLLPALSLSDSTANPFLCPSQPIRNTPTHPSPPKAITAQIPILNQPHLSVPSSVKIWTFPCSPFPC
jgi:hypothetical protein